MYLAVLPSTGPTTITTLTRDAASVAVGEPSIRRTRGPGRRSGTSRSEVDRLLDALWAPSVWTCKSCSFLPERRAEARRRCGGRPKQAWKGGRIGGPTRSRETDGRSSGEPMRPSRSEAPERRQVSAVGAASSVWACLLRLGVGVTVTPMAVAASLTMGPATARHPGEGADAPPTTGPPAPAPLLRCRR